MWRRRLSNPLLAASACSSSALPTSSTATRNASNISTSHATKKPTSGGLAGANEARSSCFYAETSLSRTQHICYYRFYFDKRISFPSRLLYSCKPIIFWRTWGENKGERRLERFLELDLLCSSKKRAFRFPCSPLSLHIGFIQWA